MAIFFRIDSREDFAVGGEKKKLPVPCKGNSGPVPSCFPHLLKLMILVTGPVISKVLYSVRTSNGLVCGEGR